MAVLVEGVSVIIRADKLLAEFDGDWEAFKAIVPNETLCADGELVRVGFMSPREARDFINRLAEFGLHYVVDGRAQDLTVVDQQRGPATPTSWAEFGMMEYQGDPAKRVAVGRLMGSEVKQMVAPDWWQYEGSLTASHVFLETPKKAGGEAQTQPRGPSEADLKFLGGLIKKGMKAQARGFTDPPARARPPAASNSQTHKRNRKQDPQ